MNKTELIHNGVSKKVYATDEADKVIIEYTDTITAYYKIKRAVIKDKGLYCNAISSEIFRILANAGVPVHFMEKLSDTEQVCCRVDAIPIEVIVRNVIAGSMAQRLGIEEGVVPAKTVIDLCYKNEDLAIRSSMISMRLRSVSFRRRNSLRYIDLRVRSMMSSCRFSKASG